MVSAIFIFLFAVGILFSVATGNTSNLTNAFICGPKEAISIFFNTAYTLIFWSGILQICIDSGLLNILGGALSCLIRPLFRGLDKNDVALKYMSLNLISNMLSVGSAATPFGLKAFKRLSELNNFDSKASKEMIMFLNLNSSCLCVLPVSLISTRVSYGGMNNSLVVILLIIIGGVLMLFSICLNKVCAHFAWR